MGIAAKEGSVCVCVRAHSRNKYSSSLGQFSEGRVCLPLPCLAWGYTHSAGYGGSRGLC